MAEQYSDEYFTGGGAGYSDYLSEGVMLRERGHWYADKIRRWVPKGELLDVGAAAGFFLAGFCDRGWRGQGIEPNNAMASHARLQLGLKVGSQSFEQFYLESQNRSQFDLITMVQVLPHFVDPFAALQRARDLLRPGGSLLIETWNVESLTAQAFGKQWHEYSPPSVLHWFEPKRLQRLLSGLGFQRISSGRPKKCLSVGHAKSLLKHTLGRSLGRAAEITTQLLPDKWMLAYPAEDLFWALYRRHN